MFDLQLREVDATVICTSHSNPFGFIGPFADKAVLVEAFTRASKKLVIIGDIAVGSHFILTLDLFRLWPLIQCGRTF